MEIILGRTHIVGTEIQELLGAFLRGASTSTTTMTTTTKALLLPSGSFRALAIGPLVRSLSLGIGSLAGGLGPQQRDGGPPMGSPKCPKSVQNSTYPFQRHAPSPQRRSRQSLGFGKLMNLVPLCLTLGS